MNLTLNLIKSQTFIAFRSSGYEIKISPQTLQPSSIITMFAFASFMVLNPGGELFLCYFFCKTLQVFSKGVLNKFINGYLVKHANF